MGKKKIKKVKTALLKMGPTLSIYDVKRLQRDLLDGLGDNEVLELDVGDINECDAAGLQLLYSTIKTAEDMKKRLVVSGESEALIRTFQMAGMDTGMIAQRQEGAKSDGPIG